MTKTYLSIGDVLSLLRQEFPDITISKIRFLESQGLVNPQRSASGYRKFYEHDVERLRWVLRQQREHFLPLKVIRDRLDAEGGGIPSSNGEAAAVGAVRSHQAVARTNRADVVETVLDEPAALGAHSLRPNGNGVIHPTDVVSVLAAVSAGAPERDETTHASAAVPLAERPRSPVHPPSESVATGAPTVDETHAHREPAVPPPAVAPRATASHKAEPVATQAHSGEPPAEPPATRHDRPTDAGAGAGAQAERTSARSKAEPASPPAPRARQHGAPGAGEGFSLSAGPSGASLTAEELAQASGLSEIEIASLEGFGLVQSSMVAGETYYDEDALTVAQLVAQFAAYGIEPRHLRLHHNAVDRELGLIEQVTTPLLRQRNPEARQRAIDTATELARLGQSLRASLLRTELRRHLGS